MGRTYQCSIHPLDFARGVLEYCYNCPMSRKQIIKKALVFFLLITTISAVLIYIQNRIGLEKIKEVIVEAGIWGPILYILLHLLTHIVAPLQGSPFFILAIAIFGKWAIIYTYIVSVISSFTNFWISRKLGRDIVTKLVSKDGMVKIDHIASSQEGVKTLIIMRFFQGYITDFVSYAAGLTSIDFKKYYLISVLVPLPWTFGWFFFFDKLPQEKVFFWALITGGVAFIIPPTYYYLKHKIVHGKVVHKKSL